MILHQKIALCLVIFTIAGIVVNKKKRQTKPKGLDCKKFIKIIRFIRAELPLRLNVIESDTGKYKVFREIDTASLTGINEVLVYKLKLLYNSIQEICYYFDIEISEFISFFNTLSNEKHAKYLNPQGFQCSRPNFDWPNEFGMKSYCEILKKYLLILENYLKTENYLEFLLQENLLYDSLWKLFKINDSVLRAASYKYFQNPVVKLYINKINSIKAKIKFKPLDLPDLDSSIKV